ncbi:MAG: hypothetical protein ACI9MC_004082 [Kiritimatiellia bacterium]
MVCALIHGAWAGSPEPAPVDDPIMQALIVENEATMSAWKGAEDAPYFLGFRVVERTTNEVVARAGGISTLPQVRRGRSLTVNARIGS